MRDQTGPSNPCSCRRIQRDEEISLDPQLVQNGPRALEVVQIPVIERDHYGARLTKHMTETAVSDRVSQLTTKHRCRDGQRVRRARLAKTIREDVVVAQHSLPIRCGVCHSRNPKPMQG